MSKRDFTGFEFIMSFGRISYIAQHPRFSIGLLACMWRGYWDVIRNDKHIGPTSTHFRFRKSHTQVSPNGDVGPKYNTRKIAFSRSGYVYMWTQHCIWWDTKWCDIEHRERRLPSLCILPITRYRLWHDTCSGETAWLRCSAGTGPWGWPQLLYQLDADNTITCCQTHTLTTHPINGAVFVTGAWFDMGPAAARRASPYTTLTSHERHDVSNHQQHGCLFNSLFKSPRNNKSKLNMWRAPLEIQNVTQQDLNTE